MIILGKSVAHITNLVNYIFLEEKQHVFLSSDGLDMNTAASIIDDFKLCQSKSKRLKKKFISLVLSPSINDNVSDDTFRALVLDTLQKLNLTNRQYVSVLHTQSESMIRHAHVLVSRVDYDLNTYSDQFIGIKCMESANELALKYELTNASDIRRERTKDLFSKRNITENPSDREIAIQQINDMVKEVLYLPTTQSVDDIYDHLINKHTIDIEIEQFKNGKYGVKLKFSTYEFNSSEVNRLLSVEPDGESYKANRKLQFFLDRNISRSEGRRKLEDVQQDIMEYPDYQSYLIPEISFIATAMRELLNASKNDDYEDEKQKYLAKKYRRRPKMIGPNNRGMN